MSSEAVLDDNRIRGAADVASESENATHDENSADNNTITFSDKDLEGIEVPHNDALVVTMTVANTKVDKILVNTEFPVNELSLSALKRMGLTLEKDVDRRPEKQVTLYDQEWGETKSLGEITLSVTAGTEPKSSTVDMVFLVVDSPSKYGITLGRPGLQALRAVSSTYHLLLRFPTKAGVGEVRGDQLLARECSEQQAAEMNNYGVEQWLEWFLDLDNWCEVCVGVLVVSSLFQSYLWISTLFN